MCEQIIGAFLLISALSVYAISHHIEEVRHRRMTKPMYNQKG